MDPVTATGLVRVFVIGDDAAADLALPAKLPIRQLIRQIRTELDPDRDIDAGNVDDDAAATDDDRPIRPYSLGPIVGTPFSPDATLESLGVVEGASLRLRMLPPGPAAPPVVEDIADAAAIHSAAQFSKFKRWMLVLAAQVTFLAVGVFITALATYDWHREHRWWPVIVLAGVTAVFVTATVISIRRGPTQLAGRLGVTTPVPLALALALALSTAWPEAGAAPAVFLAAAFVLAWSVLLIVITSQWVAVHATIITVSAVVLVAAAVRGLAHLPYVALGSGVIAIALYVAHRAPIASAVSARYPLPNVPAPGERTPDRPSRTALEALPRKVAVSHAYQSGYVAASVVLSVIGSVLVLWLPDRPALAAWWLVVATAVANLLKARIWDSATAALWFVASPLVTTVALATSFTATGHRMAGLAAAGVLVVLTVLLIGAAAIGNKEGTLPQRRYLDLFENTLLFTILPTVLWLTGIVSMLRNWGSI